MAASSGPDIADSGLVLALDAADINSFDKYENLMTNSQLGNTILNDGSGVTLTTDTSIINPFGVYDGVLKCVHTTNTPGYFRRGQNMSLTAGVTYTFSFFFKNGTVVSPYGQSPIYIGVLASTYSPTFQELSQSLNTTISFPDGWYRQVFTFTPGYTQTYQIDFNQANNQTPIGTYYLYGFQLERGSSVSTYYQTTATAKTRGSTIIDLSGNGNTGTLTNGPTYSSANGGSIVFDGTNDYISITENTTYQFSNTQPFSLSLWVRCTATSGAPVIFSYALTSGRGYYFTIDVNALRTNAFFFDYWDGTTFRGIQGNNNSIIMNSWVNLVATSSSNSVNDMKVYQNGVLTSYTNRGTGTPNSIDYSTLTTRIGARGDGGYFTGNIAQVQVYNRALTEAEVQQNFNAVRSRFGI